MEVRIVAPLPVAVPFQHVCGVRLDRHVRLRRQLLRGVALAVDVVRWVRLRRVADQDGNLRALAQATRNLLPYAVGELLVDARRHARVHLRRRGRLAVPHLRRAVVLVPPQLHRARVVRDRVVLALLHQVLRERAVLRVSLHVGHLARRERRDERHLDVPCQRVALADILLGVLYRVGLVGLVLVGRRRVHVRVDRRLRRALRASVNAPNNLVGVVALGLVLVQLRNQLDRRVVRAVVVGVAHRVWLVDAHYLHLHRLEFTLWEWGSHTLLRRIELVDARFVRRNGWSRSITVSCSIRGLSFLVPMQFIYRWIRRFHQVLQFHGRIQTNHRIQLQWERRSINRNFHLLTRALATSRAHLTDEVVEHSLVIQRNLRHSGVIEGRILLTRLGRRMPL